MLSDASQSEHAKRGGVRTDRSVYDLRVHATGRIPRNPADIGERLKAMESWYSSTVTTREEIEMPLAKIHVLEVNTTRLDSAGCRAPSRTAHQRLGYSPEDFFQIIHVLPRVDSFHTPSFLGLSYSDNLIVLEITFNLRPPQGEKTRLLKPSTTAVVLSGRHLSRRSPHHALQTPGENISSAAAWLNVPMSHDRKLEPGVPERSLPSMTPGVRGLRSQRQKRRSQMRAMRAESFTGYGGMKLVEVQDLVARTGGCLSGSQQPASPRWTTPSCRRVPTSNGAVDLGQ